MSRIGDKVQLRGWVRTVRAQKELSFVEVNDGSNLSGIQAVVTDAAEGVDLLAEGQGQPCRPLTLHLFITAAAAAAAAATTLPDAAVEGLTRRP